MEPHHPAGWLAVVNTIANLAIVVGYLAIPFTVLARLPVTRSVRISGVFFFLCCAITHLSMACMPDPPWWLVADHVVQAAAVWGFVGGFAHLVGKATRHRRHGARK